MLLLLLLVVRFQEVDEMTCFLKKDGVMVINKKLVGTVSVLFFSLLFLASNMMASSVDSLMFPSGGFYEEPSLKLEGRATVLDLMVDVLAGEMSLSKSPPMHNYPRGRKQKVRVKPKSDAKEDAAESVSEGDPEKSVEEWCVEFYTDEDDLIIGREQWLKGALNALINEFRKRYAGTFKTDVTQSFILGVSEFTLSEFYRQDGVYKSLEYQSMLKIKDLEVDQKDYLLFLQVMNVLNSVVMDNLFKMSPRAFFMDSMVYNHVQPSNGGFNFALKSLLRNDTDASVWVKGVLELLCLELTGQGSPSGINYLTGLLNEIGVIKNVGSVFQVGEPAKLSYPGRGDVAIKTISPLTLIRNMQRYYTERHPNAGVVTVLSRIDVPRRRSANVFVRTLSTVSAGSGSSECDALKSPEKPTLPVQSEQKARLVEKKRPEPGASACFSPDVSSQESISVLFRNTVAKADAEEAKRLYQAHKSELEQRKSWERRDKPCFVFLLKLKGGMEGFLKKHKLLPDTSTENDRD